MGSIKKVFDAEVYAICQALCIEARRATASTPSPWTLPQKLKDPVGTRLRVRSNEVTVRWIPAHQAFLGNEKADEYAKAAADGSEPEDAVPDGYRWEARLSHMTRVATGGRGPPMEVPPPHREGSRA